MAQLKSIKRWFWWHCWTSLICTLFLLLLCLTGSPLIFAGEIDGQLNPPDYAEMPANTPDGQSRWYDKAGQTHPHFYYLPQNIAGKNFLAQTQITYTTNPNNSYYE